MTTPNTAPSSSAPASAPAPASSSPATSTSSAPQTSSSSSSSSAPTQSMNRSETKSLSDVVQQNLPGAAEQQQAASEQVAAAEASKEQARKLRLKIHGEERELSEEEVIRRAQLAEAADTKFKQASEMRKQAEDFLEALRTNPLAVLTHPNLGINFRELAEQFLAGEIKKEMLSPEQRELEEAKARLAQYEEQERRKAEQAAEMQRQELTKRVQAEYEKKITDVLSKSDLPRTPYTLKRVAEVLHGALSKGVEMDIQTAVDFVREGYQSDLKSLVEPLDGDQLIKILGDSLVGKLRKYDLGRLKAQLQPPVPPPAVPQSPTAETKPVADKMTPDEWREYIRKKAGV